MQLRSRLTIQFIVIVASILLLALYFIHYEFVKMSESEFYESLRSKALMTAEMIMHDEEKLKVIDNQDNSEETNILPIKDNVIIFNKNWERVFAYHHAELTFDKSFFQRR